MVKISENLQTQFPAYLQSVAKQEIDDRNLDEYTLAEKLDLFPEGARRIMADQEWSAERGIQVLGALGLNIEIQVSPVQSAE